MQNSYEARNLYSTDIINTIPSTEKMRTGIYMKQH
jgi:hypothetical protein